MGLKSLRDNIRQGKIGAAIADGIGVLLDAAAVAMPFVPGGVSAAITAVRVVDRGDDIVDAGKGIKNADAIGSNQSLISTKPFNGKLDTDNSTSREALRNAKDQNGIPRSAQPDKTVKSGTIEGDQYNLDERNVKLYEYTNSKGQKVLIRHDKPTAYTDGGKQPAHFNAGLETDKKLKQHHNYGN